MPKPQWHFRKFAPGDNLSDPDFTKALFASDSDATATRSLVREALQNSLDAKADDVSHVRVRIAIYRNERGASPAAAAAFLSGLQPHMLAKDNGLSDSPNFRQAMPFLVMEDFGSRGLCGDPEHWRPTNIGKNGFFLFFRALGRSGKENEARGRWGVGKFVFPMSSQGHTVFGLTIPVDTKVPILMGRSVLRTHEASSAQWHPDGHWGERLDPQSNLVSPCRDAELISAFQSTFDLARRTEPGLSVVVPWLKDEIGIEAVRHAVMAEYFLPLLRGELVVELEDNGANEVINGSSVRIYSEQAEDRKLRERLKLAADLIDGKGLSAEWPKTLAWDDLVLRREDLPDPLRYRINEGLDQGQVVSISVPVTVGRKDTDPPRRGSLSVHLRRVDGLGGMRPLILRDGISLAEDKTKTLFDHACLLVAERCALATAIGDAETPAHEHMQHELLKDRYKYPRKLVTFVREAASTLLGALRHGEDEDDRFSLASFFPLVAEAGPLKPKPRDRKPTGEPDPTIPPIPDPSIRRFRIIKEPSGFSIVGNPVSNETPDEILVTVAYDVRRGNPFAKYRPYDFDLSSPEMKRDSSSCIVAGVEGNRMVIRPGKSDFRISVTGFDRERDLIVRAVAVGGHS